VRVLITRPRPAATALAARLAALGHQAVVEPLLTIVQDTDARVRLEPALTGAQALLFTSTNGVTSFSGASERRDLRVFAVGDGTAAAARQAGFAQVESAQANVEALAALVACKLRATGGPLVHASGHAIAGDLAARLDRSGFAVRSIPLYQAITADKLSPETIVAFRSGTTDAALFFSPRTAATFVRLARAAGLAGAGVVGVALSPAVAAELEGLQWRRIVTAEVPTEAAVIDALNRLEVEMRGVGRPIDD
jgi:uroporphyrinogen-III synthase